jgi:hypothetical protein
MMVRTQWSRYSWALWAALLACPSAVRAEFTFSASGADAAAITPTVTNFRNALGTLNPNVAGSFGAGRREINWDGVPDNFADPNDLPNNFFNANSPRGAVFSTPGSAVRVSANAVNPTGTPVEFGSFNPQYPNSFQTFSPQRLFSAVGSNIVDVNFFIPGTNTPALVRAFGAVFTDVDSANSTSLQFFAGNNTPLANPFSVAVADNGLSFLGVDFTNPVIGRVRITSGNTALGPNDSATADVVAMDDFIYAEPVPEPSSVVLLAGGAPILAAFFRCSRRQP